MADADQHAELVDTIATLHARVQKDFDSHQRLIERITQAVGRPRSIYTLAVFIAFWGGFNTLAHRAIDPPPFFWMQGVASIFASLVTLMVLTTQNRLQRHNEHRAYLDLQVNLIAERKTAKIIELLEELRRDLPSVRNRVDAEAASMARSVDAEEVLTALVETLDTSALAPDDSVAPFPAEPE